MYNRLKEEIIATEYEMIIFEQILLYSIEEAKKCSEGIYRQLEELWI